MYQSAYRLVRRSGVDSLAWQFTQLFSLSSIRASCGVDNFVVLPETPATLRKAPKAPTDSFFSIVCLLLDKLFSTGSGRDRVNYSELRNFQHGRVISPCWLRIKPNCVLVKKERSSIQS